jgi:hypothetical protein
MSRLDQLGDVRSIDGAIFDPPFFLRAGVIVVHAVASGPLGIVSERFMVKEVQEVS